MTFMLDTFFFRSSHWTTNCHHVEEMPASIFSPRVQKGCRKSARRKQRGERSPKLCTGRPEGDKNVQWVERSDGGSAHLRSCHREQAAYPLAPNVRRLRPPPRDTSMTSGSADENVAARGAVGSKLECRLCSFPCRCCCCQTSGDVDSLTDGREKHRHSLPAPIQVDLSRSRRKKRKTFCRAPSFYLFSANVNCICASVIRSTKELELDQA